VRFLKAGQLNISDCEIVGAGRHAMLLDAVSGEVTDTAITEARDTALLSSDARGLLVARNTITRAGDNGIQIFRRGPGDDGTFVIDNRVEHIDNRSGGNGPYGNGINFSAVAMSPCAATASRTAPFPASAAIRRRTSR
jgi:uncharacterized secreted repeat protein (TIGR03808 family)